MKRLTSVKTRITIWYTSLMLVLIAVVLSLVGSLSYRLSIDNIEKDVTLQVTQVSEKITKRQQDVFHSIDSSKDFKNVSIYESNGEYITGQYIYDIANIKFREGRPRRESVDGREYIVYDVLKHGEPGGHGGFWIRGAESVNSTILLGRSAVIITLIIIPIILFLTALGGYYITKKAFLPVNGIIKTANDISSQNDITRRIEIPAGAKEDELYKLSVTLNEMLDKIESLINSEKQFTSDASHELRTPISVILAQGEYLSDIAESDKEKELAENIVAKAKQVSTLISRLLLLARIDRNRQKFNKEKVDLGILTDIAVDGMKDLAAQKEILLLTNVEDNLIVEADESLLLSAISNLIGNGIKYGNKSGYVSVSASRLGNAAEITVKDNGIGISEEHIDKIWGRFYRIDDVRNDEYGSSGLGLAMVKSIIKLHGGEITVKSTLGKGTEFRIILPTAETT